MHYYAIFEWCFTSIKLIIIITLLPDLHGKIAARTWHADALPQFASTSLPPPLPPLPPPPPSHHPLLPNTSTLSIQHQHGTNFAMSTAGVSDLR